jgi:hypothetical protein
VSANHRFTNGRNSGMGALYPRGPRMVAVRGDLGA